MSKTTNIFSTAPTQVQNKSGFDMSFESIGTASVGTLIPVLTERVLPGDKFSLGLLQRLSLPPMATDFYGRVDVKFEAFFVPNRLLWGGWNDYITQFSDDYNEKITSRPYIVNNTEESISLGASSLADYLGSKTTTNFSEDTSLHLDALPFIAYHRIYDDYYRNSQIQKRVFQHGFSSDAPLASNLPYIRNVGNLLPSDLNLADDSWLDQLRQRNYSKDYFTTATPNPQLGNPSTLEFDVTGDKGSFTIASLRMANSLQKFLERNNLVGFDYYEQTKAQFGVRPTHLCNRPIYLGSQSFNIYNNSVTQTNPSSNSDLSSSNPIKGVGAKYAQSESLGSGSLVDGFTATEHGFFMVLMSVVPHSYYGSGIRRYITDLGIADEGFPILASVGDQTIKNYELNGDLESFNHGDFGYVQRFSQYKFHIDEVHGLLRDGNSLSSFALKRSFAGSPDLSTDFLQVPTDALNEVLAVKASTAGFGYWYDIAFQFKMVRALPVYSIPTLGDEKDTHTVMVNKGGSKLN